VFQRTRDDVTTMTLCESSEEKASPTKLTGKSTVARIYVPHAADTRMKYKHRCHIPTKNSVYTYAAFSSLFRFSLTDFSLPKGDRKLGQRSEMADGHGRGKEDRPLQAQRRIGQREFFASENWIPRVDQRYIDHKLD